MDVGSGPGRIALPLAFAVEQVVAVDANQAMLDVLQSEAARLGLHNIDAVSGRWEDVEVGTANVVVCSYVLAWVGDAVGFLAKIDRTATQRAVVCMSAISPDAFMDPVWRRFHGRPRQPLPTYLDAIDVLGELGVEPEVEIVAVPSLSRYASLDDAVAEYRRMLLVGHGDDIGDKLATVLGSWLSWRDGFLRPPVRTAPAAIVSWTRDRRR